jgi:hypothetical protein
VYVHSVSSPFVQNEVENELTEVTEEVDARTSKDSQTLKSETTNCI